MKAVITESSVDTGYVDIQYLSKAIYFDAPKQDGSAHDLIKMPLEIVPSPFHKRRHGRRSSGTTQYCQY